MGLFAIRVPINNKVQKLLHLGLDGLTNRSGIHLATLTEDAIQTWSLQPQVILNGWRKLEISLGSS